MGLFLLIVVRATGLLSLDKKRLNKLISVVELIEMWIVEEIAVEKGLSVNASLLVHCDSRYTHVALQGYPILWTGLGPQLACCNAPFFCNLLVHRWASENIKFHNL